MDGKAQERKEQAARLRQARAAAGYETATEAAEAMREPVPTYTLHENGGRGYKAKAAKYAKQFKTTPEWLLWGRQAGDARTNRINQALQRFSEQDRDWAEGVVIATLETLARRPRPRE